MKPTGGNQSQKTFHVVSKPGLREGVGCSVIKTTSSAFLTLYHLQGRARELVGRFGGPANWDVIGELCFSVENG